MAVALMSAALTPAGATVQVGRQPHGSIAVALQEITGSPASHSCPRNKPRTGPKVSPLCILPVLPTVFQKNAQKQRSPLDHGPPPGPAPTAATGRRQCPPPSRLCLSSALQLSAGAIVPLSLRNPFNVSPKQDKYPQTPMGINGFTVALLSFCF